MAVMMRSILDVADNSGARRLQMILPLGGHTGLNASLGDVVTAAVKEASPDGTAKLSGAPYYLAFAGMMFVTALGFIAFAARYREQRHIQGMDEGDGSPPAGRARKRGRKAQGNRTSG